MVTAKDLIDTLSASLGLERDERDARPAYQIIASRKTETPRARLIALTEPRTKPGITVQAMGAREG